MTVEHIALDRIRENPNNPRKHFDEAKLAELANDIELHGVLQPILVRPHGADYELVFGARRFRAAGLAELETIPAQVKELTDEKALELALVENAKREGIHPLSEAESFYALHHKHGNDVASIAAKVGRSVAYVYDRMRLLSLTAPAQELFRAGRFTAGHAVILARLTPEQQAIALSSERAILFTPQRLLWSPNESAPEERWKDQNMKTCSVRELQAWVDANCKFDPRAEDTPMLFPETAQAVASATEEAEKVVPITWEHQVATLARDGTRVYTTRSWKRADGKAGSKTCEHSSTGVVVVGPGRGEAFRVCTAKKVCKAHWGKEIRERAAARKAKAKGQGTTGERRAAREAAERAERQRQEQERKKQWRKAKPRIIKAINEKLAKTSAKSSGPLAALLIREVTPYRKSRKALPLGRTSEDLVRHLASIVLTSLAENEWQGPRELPKLAKSIGVDLRKVLADEKPKKAASGRKPRKPVSRAR